MVRLLRHVYNVPGIPRLTSDADTGIDVNVASTGDLHDRLTALGYITECGNRYERGEQAVDLLVPTAAKPGKRIIGERAFDGAPGLRVALALPPIEIAVTARLTEGDIIEFEVPVRDVEAAFVLKMLARTVRDSERDLQDIETLLAIVGVTTRIPRITVAPRRPQEHKGRRARRCCACGSANDLRSADEGAGQSACAAPAPCRHRVQMTHQRTAVRYRPRPRT